MSNLKNTPWRAVLLSYGKELACVVDSKEFHLVHETDYTTAKAIASLPETLAELEATKARVKELKEAAYPILSNWESGDGRIQVAKLMLNLKQVLE